MRTLTNERRCAIQVLEGGTPHVPPPPPVPQLPIRVVIDEVEKLADVIRCLDDAIEYAPGDPILSLQLREWLVELMDRAIHHESDLEVRYAQLVQAARAEIAQTGNVTATGPLVHLRHALANLAAMPPAGATPTQLLAQA